MHKKLIEFNQAQRKNDMPALKSGDVVKVYRKITEKDKDVSQIFEGMIIAMKGGQSSSPTITVRKVSDGIGVELILPVFSPLVEKITVVKRAKVRRSKLYYLRTKSAKSMKLKYTDAKK
jgi:large subunit ribosomal protein L19